MQSKSDKENNIPASARKGELPLPKSLDVKRKRINKTSTPLESSSRSAVSRSPNGAGGRRVCLGSLSTGERRNVKGKCKSQLNISTSVPAKRIVADAGKTPSRLATPKPPGRCINKSLFASQYSQQDIPFETDHSSMQSILNETGIQSTSSMGRHTLAATPSQRNSIYVPHKKIDGDAFKKICEDYARGSARFDAKTPSSKVQQAPTQQATGVSADSECGRRMTTNSLFSPKRRCLEKCSDKDVNHTSCTEGMFTPKHISKSQTSHMLSHGQNAKLGTLDVLTEEETVHNMTQHDLHFKENICKSAADGLSHKHMSTPDREGKIMLHKGGNSNTPLRSENPKTPLRLGAPKTPLRVIKEVAKVTAPQTPLRILKENVKVATPVTPLRVLKEKTVQADSTPGRVLISKDTRPTTPMRVLKVEKKRTNSASNKEPKQCSIFSTPMRVLKHGRNVNIEHKTTLQDTAIEQLERQKHPTNLKTIETDLNNIQTELQKQYNQATKSPVSEDNVIEERVITEKDDTDTSENFSCLDDTAVWRTKPSSLKTPVKQEVLTSNTEGGYSIQRRFSCDITDEYHGAKCHRNDHSIEHQDKTRSELPDPSARQTPEMQLPVVISPVEKSATDSEMPNKLSKNWSKSETGHSLGKNLVVDERFNATTEVTKDSIGPRKACDMSTANQNLLDRIQQRLERKLQGNGESSTKETNLFTRGPNETSQSNLNIQNNNLFITEDIEHTDEVNKTAGQFNKDFSQGFDSYITNANNTTSFDINYNIGTSDVTNFNQSDEPFSNSTNNSYIMSDAGHTNVMTHKYRPSTTKQTDITDKPCDEMPFKLRNTEMPLKVVSHTYDSSNVNIETPRSTVNLNTIVEDVKDLDNKHCIGFCETEFENASKLYAPTPCIQRTGLVTGLNSSGLSSNFPLLTPLALRMVAKRQKYTCSEDILNSQTKETEGLFYEDVSCHEVVPKIIPEEVIPLEKSLDYSNRDELEALDQETVMKTPPPVKNSAFHIVKKSSLTPLVGSLSLRGNSESLGKIKTRKRSKDKGHKQMLFMSINERYQEAVLDEEVTRFAARLVAQHVGYFPRSCRNPVAKILMEGDDMHFVPIKEMELEEAYVTMIPGSAFSKYSF